MKGTLIGKGELLNYLEDMVGSCATIRQRKFGPYEFEFVVNFGFNKFTWIINSIGLAQKQNNVNTIGCKPQLVC